MTFHNSEKKSQNDCMLSQLLDKNTEIYNIKGQNYEMTKIMIITKVNLHRHNYNFISLV